MHRLDLAPLHAQFQGVGLGLLGIHGGHGGGAQAPVGGQVVVVLELADGGDGGVVHLALDLVAGGKIAQLLQPLLIGGDGLVHLAFGEEVAHHLVGVEHVHGVVAHLAVAFDAVGLLELLHGGLGLFPEAAGDEVFAQIAQLVETGLDLRHVVALVAALHDVGAGALVHEQQPGPLPQLAVGVQVVMPLEADQGRLGDAAEMLRGLVALHVAQLHEPGLDHGDGGGIVPLL